MAELKRYKVELYCKILAFHDMIVEAETPEEAERIACGDAAQLSLHDWNLSEVDDIEPNTAAYEVEMTEDEQ